MKQIPEIIPGQILSGPQFNEPMRVETVRANGSNAWVVGLVGMQSERFRSVTLSRSDLDALTIYETACTFDGDGKLLKIGLQAYSLGIAYEFDPYFGLSISRVDPLPHQLEAIYDYLLKLPRVRFLLADDAEPAAQPPERDEHDVANMDPIHTQPPQHSQLADCGEMSAEASALVAALGRRRRKNT